jgi:hypothetical protein
VDRDALCSTLRGDDADALADALQQLRLPDLAHVDVFTAALRAVLDDRPLPAAHVRKVEADPFAAFFGSEAAAAVQTIGQLAADRLREVGWPGEPGIAEAAAAVLDEVGPSERLGTIVADRLGATAWDDEAHALRTLVPRLHAWEVPLYPVIARLDDAGVGLLVASALRPYRSRAVNELLALGNGHDAMLDALQAAVLDRTIDPGPLQAMAILAQLVAWEADRASTVAASLEDRHPWAVAFAAFDDASARARFRAWLPTGTWPDALPERLDEALIARPAIDGWPLVEWLSACDGGCRVIAAWHQAADAAPLLQSWVRDPAKERAVEAAILLAGCGEAAPVAADIAALVADPDLADLWTPEGLSALVAARPEELDVAIGAMLRRSPERAAALVPAYLACEPPADRVRATAEALVAHAEQAPVRRVPARRGGVRVTREGTDTTALAPLVEAVGDPGLRERLSAVAPYLGA